MRCSRIFDVEGNVAYGLEQVRPRLDRAEISRRVGEALEMVPLSSYRKRKIHELSGGLQQRVALARAIINGQGCFSWTSACALDRSFGQPCNSNCRDLHRELGITFLLVTHDQEEALSMSDQFA